MSEELLPQAPESAGGSVSHPSAPAVPAPFRFGGYPGVPLLGSRRSVGNMIGVFVACTVLLVAFVGAGGLILQGTSLPSGTAALIQLGAYGLAYGSWLVVAAAGRKRAGVPYSEWVALRRFSTGPGLLAAVAALALALGFYLTFTTAVTLFGVEVPQQPTVIDIFPVTPLGIAVAFLSVCIIGPLGEEVLFRGVIFGGLRDRIGEAWAIAISAALFAAAHVSWFVFVPFFVFGVLLARVTSQSRSVWPAFVAHALFNLNALVLTYLLHFLGGAGPSAMGRLAEAMAVLLR